MTGASPLLAQSYYMPPPLISSLSWHALTLPRHVRPHLKIRERERLVGSRPGRGGKDAEIAVRVEGAAV